MKIKLEIESAVLSKSETNKEIKKLLRKLTYRSKGNIDYCYEISTIDRYKKIKKLTKKK